MSIEFQASGNLAFSRKFVTILTSPLAFLFSALPRIQSPPISGVFIPFEQNKYMDVKPDPNSNCYPDSSCVSSSLVDGYQVE